jgi:hypothetical protein
MATGIASERERVDDPRLERCEGYRVEGPDGSIGYVDKVVRFTEDDGPRYLSVRAGRDGTLLLLVALGDVAGVFPPKELVVLRRQYAVDGAPAAWGRA